MNTKSVADILADAREYLEKKGWMRGRLFDRYTGKVCARGAICAGQGWNMEGILTADQQLLLNQAEDRLMSVVGKHYRNVPNWNDAVAEDQQEVLDAFAKAEKIERAGFDPDEGMVA